MDNWNELLGTIANLLEVVGSIAAVMLVLRAGFIDWHRHRTKDFTSEIAVSLNRLQKKDGSRRVLKIRTIAEMPLLSALGDNSHIAGILLKAAKRLRKKRWSVIELKNEFDADVICNLIRNQISQITGKEFLLQDVADTEEEEKYIFVVTSEISHNRSTRERKIRIQLMKENVLEELCSEAGGKVPKDLLWGNEVENERYLRRGECLRDFIWAYQQQKYQRNSYNKLAIGWVNLASSIAK